MLQRMGDLGQATRMSESMLATQARLRRAETAVASGKRAQSYAEIAGQAGRLLTAKSVRVLTQARLDQGREAIDRMTVTDGAVGEILGIAERGRALLLARLDASTGASVPLEAEIDGMLDEIEGLLNRKLGDRYLFAGSRGDQSPVHLPSPPITGADPALYYQGDDVKLTIKADDGVAVETNVTAGDQPFADLIAALGNARAGHAANSQATLASALDQLNHAFAGLTELRGGLDARMGRLERDGDSKGMTLTYLDAIVSDIEDADLPRLLTQVAQDQATLEVTYLLTGRLATLSLAEYLR